MKLHKKQIPLPLAMAVLLLGTAGSMAIVGYVNVPVNNGYNFLANPLKMGTNGVNEVIPTPADQSRVWVWNVTNQAFDPPAVYDSAEQAWSANVLLPVGEGFVLHCPTSSTTTNITFVGEVLTGSLTNVVTGSNRFSLLGSKVPMGGSLGSVFDFPVRDGQNVHQFSSQLQSFLNGQTYFSAYGWFDPSGGGGTNGPVINVGTSFFVQHPGPSTNWIQVFNPFAAPMLTTSETQTTGATPKILRLTVRKGTATLQLSRTSLDFRLQTSVDGQRWVTVNARRSGQNWEVSCPAGDRGFFRVIQP